MASSAAPLARDSATQKPAKTAVDVDAVSKVYGHGPAAHVALDNVSLTIKENELFTLLGPSGCGKTTLLRLVAGFDSPSNGDIRLYGDSITAAPPFRRPINTVFQSYALFPHMTVRQNVSFGLEMQGWKKADIHARVAEVLQLVRMEKFGDRGTDQISGGQAQRVALARALAPKPKLLLLDEPLSALDYKLRKEMQIELKRLQHETGITFVFVTHDQEEALALSDRIAVMSAGKVLQVGGPKEIYDRPADHFVASFIGDTNFIEGQVVSRAGNQARVRVFGNIEIGASLPQDFDAGPNVTLVVRPEHMRIVPPREPNALQATVKSVIFIGSDTLLHVDADGRPFALRLQNSAIEGEQITQGSRISIALPASGLQILRQ